MSESLVERLRLRAANRRRENSAMRRMDAEVMEAAADALEARWRPVSDTFGLIPGRTYLTCNDRYQLCDLALYGVQREWHRYQYVDAYPTHWTEWPLLPWESK